MEKGLGKVLSGPLFERGDASGARVGPRLAQSVFYGVSRGSGSLFFCILFFGEAKKRMTSAGRNRHENQCPRSGLLIMMSAITAEISAAKGMV